MRSLRFSHLLFFLLAAVFVAGCGGRFVNPGSQDASLRYGIANPASVTPASDAKK